MDDNETVSTSSGEDESTNNDNSETKNDTKKYSKNSDVVSQDTLEIQVDINNEIQIDNKTSFRDLGVSKSITMSYESHRLTSRLGGESQIEKLARRLETRRAERISITKATRIDFLSECEKIKKREGYLGIKIHKNDLFKFRDEVKVKYKYRTKNLHSAWNIVKALGFFDPKQKLVSILEKACVEQEKVGSDWFYYGDFNFFYTKVVPTWPIMRSSIGVALATIVAFFAFTPILFCGILKENGVCPSDPTDKNRRWYGQVTSIYYASMTMSTVGYGDLSVFAGEGEDKPDGWVVFLATLYMIAALIVAMLAFGAAADAAFSPSSYYFEKFRDWFVSKFSRGDLLYQKLKWLRIVKYLEIITSFLIVNLIGIFALKFFWNTDQDYDEREHWTWVEAFYWSVQTTTTIGYGDLAMSYYMRIFLALYLLLSTYAVGAALGKLQTLKVELVEARKELAWERREISKQLIRDMSSGDGTERVDQFEFVVSSLLTLGKLSYDDIHPIMDKFRQLDKDGNGFITSDDATEEISNKVDNDSV